MVFHDWAALIIGGGLIFSGVRGIRREHVEIPEDVDGAAAVRISWLWLFLGVLFVAGVAFDLAVVKWFFRLFLETA